MAEYSANMNEDDPFSDWRARQKRYLAGDRTGFSPRELQEQQEFSKVGPDGQRVAKDFGEGASQFGSNFIRDLTSLFGMGANAKAINQPGNGVPINVPTPDVNTGDMNLIGDEMPIQGGITSPWVDPDILEATLAPDWEEANAPGGTPGPKGVPAPPIPPVTRGPRLPPPHPAGPQPGALGPLGLTEQQQVDSDRSRARSRAEEAGIERGNVIRPTEGPGLDSQGIISMLLEFFREQEARRARGLKANPEAFRRTEATGEFSGV